LLSATAALVGCGVPGVPKPPSLDLPEPVTDLRAVRKGDRVYLNWTVPTETTDRIRLRHLGRTRICRSLLVTMTTCLNPVAEVPPPRIAGASPQRNAKPAANAQQNYIDNLPQTLLSENPGARIFYGISVLNENGRGAGISNVVNVPAAAALPPPSDFRAEVTAEGIILRWTGIPHVPEKPALRHTYRVYRRLEGGDTDAVVGEVPLEASVAQVVDHSFEWERTYFYRATVATLIHEEGKPEVQFEGDDTPAVKVFVHDVFPPAAPNGLQAVFSGVGQQPFIDLIWAPDTDADLAGYNVFRREAGGEPVKINPELVKEPAFRDMSIASGKTYFYSVSAIDVRGNESAHSEEASEAVP
jgi:hypothetical protein